MGGSSMSTVTYIRLDPTGANEFTKIPSADVSVFNKESEYYQHYLNISPLSASGVKKYSCGIDASPPSYSKKIKSGESFLTFITKGSGTVNGTAFHAGQYFMSPPNTKIFMTSDSDDPYTLCWLSWSGNISPRFTEAVSSLSSGKLYILQDPERFFSFFSGFVHLGLSEKSVDHMMEAFAEILSSIVEQSHLAYDENDRSLISPKKLDYVRYAKEIISQQYSSISITSLAKELHLNRKYFCQLFHEIEGRSPQQFLIDTRLGASIHYLEETQMTLLSISSVIGYSTYNGFAAAFRTKYGIYPGEYRRMKGKTERMNG